MACVASRSRRRLQLTLLLATCLCCLAGGFILQPSGRFSSESTPQRRPFRRNQGRSAVASAEMKNESSSGESAAPKNEGVFQQAFSLFNQLFGDSSPAKGSAFQQVKGQPVEELPTEKAEAPPSPKPLDVLVLGATSPTGRALVRLLLSRGYRVRVYVSSELMAEARAALGDDVQYFVGEYSDLLSVFDAVRGADKVVFLETGELLKDSVPRPFQTSDWAALLNVLVALNYSAKDRYRQTLLDFRQSFDRTLLSIEERGLLRPNWPKDRQEGASAAWCETRFFRGQDLKAGADKDNTFAGRDAKFFGNIMYPQNEISLMSVPLTMNLDCYGGLMIRWLRDKGRPKYKLVIRTQSYWQDGIQFEADIDAPNKITKTLVPFSSFLPHVNGVPLMSVSDNPSGAVLFDRSDIVQLGIVFRRTREGFEEEFGARIQGIEAYREQTAPELLFVSSSALPPVVDRTQWNFLRSRFESVMGNPNDPLFDTHRLAFQAAHRERTVQLSAVPFCSLRVPDFGDESAEETQTSPSAAQPGRLVTRARPSGDKRTVSSVSKEDVAAAIVACLDNPKVVNRALYLERETLPFRSQDSGDGVLAIEHDAASAVSVGSGDVPDAVGESSPRVPKPQQQATVVR